MTPKPVNTRNWLMVGSAVFAQHTERPRYVRHL